MLVSPMLTIEEAEQGHDLHVLVKFCIEFETLYSIEKVTPNMHMHTHLVECIMDYGPVYAFWLFSFERYTVYWVTIEPITGQWKFSSCNTSCMN